MASEVRQVAHVLYPQDAGDEGPWRNSDANAELARLVDQGFEVVSTSTELLRTEWVRAMEVVTDLRLVVVTTLARVD